jgi:cyclopropane fatty-acyl-phospholipid synthase-like methyltransferase
MVRAYYGQDLERWHESRKQHELQELSIVRPDLAFIAHWVREGAHVLDVGCGDGAMMDYLQTDKQCTGYGIEIADDKVLDSTRRGVRVIQQDMEKGLGLFGDNSSTPCCACRRCR